MAISENKVRPKVLLTKSEYERVKAMAAKQRVSAAAYMSRLIIDGLEVDEIRAGIK